MVDHRHILKSIITSKVSKMFTIRFLRYIKCIKHIFGGENLNIIFSHFYISTYLYVQNLKKFIVKKNIF